MFGECGRVSETLGRIALSRVSDRSSSQSRFGHHKGTASPLVSAPPSLPAILFHAAGRGTTQSCGWETSTPRGRSPLQERYSPVPPPPTPNVMELHRCIPLIGEWWLIDFILPLIQQCRIAVAKRCTDLKPRNKLCPAGFSRNPAVIGWWRLVGFYLHSSTSAELLWQSDTLNESPGTSFALQGSLETHHE